MMVCQSAPPASRPEPRLTARSMLSLGTELFFAFWMASNSVGLPAGSPPPVRAATSTFLISLANILPRLASMTAFLCLVVAHLEWPDISVPFLSRRLSLSKPPGRRRPGGRDRRRPPRGGRTSPSGGPGGPPRSYPRPHLRERGREPRPPARPARPTAPG